MKSGLERLQARGLIHDGGLIFDRDAVLDSIAQGVCDLLEHQDIIEGRMDNPEKPVGDPLTKEYYCSIQRGTDIPAFFHLGTWGRTRDNAINAAKDAGLTDRFTYIAKIRVTEIREEDNG